MQVFKFGGASISTPQKVKHIAQLIQTQHTPEALTIVVSAMGKTTNNLEEALADALERPGQTSEALERIKAFHHDMVNALFGEDQETKATTHSLLANLELLLTHLPQKEEYDTIYDMVVSFGELLSSRIMQTYLAQQGMQAQWVDARTIFRTDDAHRAATVDWHLSQQLAKDTLKDAPRSMYITQGFIGANAQGKTTTLGREGSDYSAALLGAFLMAKNVTIWKDVPGFLSADPKMFPTAQPLAELDYQEAIEMSYNGAKIIHPKAIKPLLCAEIPMHVRSFVDPDLPGTIIHHRPAEQGDTTTPPLLAVLDNITLLSITPHDLSFALEESLGDVFSLLHSYRIRPRLINNSAVSLSLCVDSDPIHLPAAMQALEQHFQLSHTGGLKLLTIRHCTPELQKLLDGSDAPLLAKSTPTARQYLLPADEWEQKLYPTICDTLARIPAQRSSDR
ncbi:MAG: aspartate kinase [Bacteroidetes bacterium]|nr:MAG: aspartate kinase [Bacteroidota bacterium]